MKLQFKKDVDFSSAKLSKFEEALKSTKPLVVLHHSEHCGHCHMMRPEFDLFKKTTSIHVVEIEGSVYKNLYMSKVVSSQVCPRSGSMYFPMIFVFTPGAPVKKHVYTGERTAAALSKFVAEKHIKDKPVVKSKESPKHGKK